MTTERRRLQRWGETGPHFYSYITVIAVGRSTSVLVFEWVASQLTLRTALQISELSLHCLVSSDLIFAYVDK